MITFFTTCKPFRGHDGIIQRNALKSWTLVDQSVEVIVFGDEEGVKEVCAEYGLRHEPQVERFESKMPFVRSLFGQAQEIARHPYLCYSNCDIIFMEDFLAAFKAAAKWRERFLMVGQRWDLDVTHAIEFARSDWGGELRQRAAASAEHQYPEYVDFFLFSKGLYEEIPPLIVGYPYWDHWMVWRALSKGVPVVDTSAAVVPVHQNHDYNTTPDRTKGSNSERLAQMNRELSGKGKHLRSILDTTYRMSPNGAIHRSRFRRQLESSAYLNARQFIAEKTFWLRKILGLRRRSTDESNQSRPAPRR